MHTYNIHEAKTHLSKLVDAVMHGEELLIAKAGKPVAKLGPVHSQVLKRKFGLSKNKTPIPEDFDAPLPKQILDDFEGV